MDAISASLGGLHAALAVQDYTALAIAEGHVTPEVVTARDQAQTQAEFEIQALKEALEAETHILDLLV